MRACPILYRSFADADMIKGIDLLQKITISNYYI